MILESEKRIPLTKGERARILQYLLKRGHSKRELARVANVTLRTINRWLTANQ